MTTCVNQSRLSDFQDDNKRKPGDDCQPNHHYRRTDNLLVVALVTVTAQDDGKHGEGNANAGCDSNQAGDAIITKVPTSQGPVVYHNCLVCRSGDGANADQGCANAHQPQEANDDILIDLAATPRRSGRMFRRPAIAAAATQMPEWRSA